MSAVAATTFKQKIYSLTEFSPFSEQQKIIAKEVALFAARMFFVFATSLMVAAIAPLAFHSVVVATVTLSSIFISPFLFTSNPQIPSKELERLSAFTNPVIEPAPLPSVALPILPIPPPGVARAFGTMNCSFNAAVHFLNSDPDIANWVRNLLPPPNADLATFENFLTSYKMPEGIIQSFRNYVLENPGVPVRVAFTQFLNTHTLPTGEFSAFRTMQKLCDLEPAFTHFFSAYDEADRENRPSIGPEWSQVLREALHQANSVRITNNSSVQHDVWEVLNTLFYFLPKHLRAEYEETTLYDTRNLPPIDTTRENVSREECECGISLGINGTRNLAIMFQKFCNEPMKDDNGVQKVGIDGVERRYYQTEKVIRFIHPPRALMLQIKRWETTDAPKSKLTDWVPQQFKGWFPKLPPMIAKNEDQFEIPPEIDVPMKDGTNVRYRLSCTIFHVGSSPEGGHYTAGLIKDNRYYLLDDAAVTPVDQQTWDQRVGTAYVLCYVPVQSR